MISRKQHGFTLIELLFVIVIISLLLGSVFFFGSQRIAELSTKTHVEEFTQFYEKNRLDNLSSSYIGTGHYDTMTLSFAGQQQAVSIQYTLGNTLISSGQFVLGSGLLFSMTQDFTIRTKPFILGCTTTQNIAPTFAIVSAMGDRYCFAIVRDSCRLDATLCTQ